MAGYCQFNIAKQDLSHLRCSEVVVFRGSCRNLQIVFTPAFCDNGWFFFGQKKISCKLTPIEKKATLAFSGKIPVNENSPKKQGGRLWL